MDAISVGEIIFRALGFIQVILVGVWMYLVWMVWKKKTNIFHDQMEPKSAERHLKWLKTFLLVAGISFAMFIASIILDKEIFGDLPEKEVTVFAYTASFSIVLFLIATIGGLVIFLKGRLKPPQRNTEISTI